MKVLLLGGTGAMGHHLTQILQHQGFDVYVTSRKYRKNLTSVTYIQGNAHDPLFLKRLLKDHWDVIVDFMVYGTAEFKDRINTLLEATDQYIFLSSSRVYAQSESPLTEESDRLLDTTSDKKYLATDEYALRKAREENTLIESQHQNWTIVRPYITYSEKRLQLGVLEKEQWLYRALQGRTIVFSKDIATQYTTLTYGYDVASSIAQLVGNPQAYHQIFHITADQAIKWATVLKLYVEVLTQRGFKPKVKMSDCAVNMYMPGAQYQVCYDRVYNRRFDNHKIHQIATNIQFTDPNEGLKQCLNTFLDKPEFLEINWELEALNDRIAGEWASFKEIKNIKQSIRYLTYRIGFLYKLRRFLRQSSN